MRASALRSFLYIQLLSFYPGKDVGNIMYQEQVKKQTIALLNVHTIDTIFKTPKQILKSLAHTNLPSMYFGKNSHYNHQILF